ncbi:MAG: MarR family winged helix-turn-helix transcriptional regulator [Armatimonadota bacterium]
MEASEDKALRTWLALLKASRVVSRILHEALREHGLSGAQFRLLRVLAEEGEPGVKLTEIGDRLGVTCGNVTGLIDRLEEMGYVMREVHPLDRRAFLAKLTPEAESLMDQLLPAYRARIGDLFSCLSGDEQETLQDLLARLEEHTQTLQEPPQKER